MGIKGSKPKLSKEDLEFLKKNTNFTEEQIKEWYKGFVVSFSRNDSPKKCVNLSARLSERPLDKGAVHKSV